MCLLFIISDTIYEELDRGAQKSRYQKFVYEGFPTLIRINKCLILSTHQSSDGLQKKKRTPHTRILERPENAF